MSREMPGCPDVGWAIVDVRDVAQAHVAALENEAADGQRFIVAIEHASMSDIAHILQRNFGPEGYRIPTRRLPSWLLKTVSLFDKTARLAVPELGLRQDVKSRRAEEILGLDFRSREQMVVDMGRSMIEYGVV